MLLQFVPLALLPLAALASPVMERSDKDKTLMCFHKDQDQLYFANGTMTKNICAELSSGILHKEYARKACIVADHDVDSFKQRCESHNSKSDPTEWKAGTGQRAVWDPKEPYDLYCFVREATFDTGPQPLTIAIDATPDVCKSMTSGKFQKNKKNKSCRVAKEDVPYFKKACKEYYPEGYPPQYSTWIPGTAIDVVME